MMGAVADQVLKQFADNFAARCERAAGRKRQPRRRQPRRAARGRADARRLSPRREPWRTLPLNGLALLLGESVEGLAALAVHERSGA